MFKSAIVAAGALLCATSLASAHAKLDAGEAVVGATWSGSAVIGHGCDGQPTLKVRVTLPPGLEAVRAPAKAGWSVEMIREPSAEPTGHSGHAAPGRVTEIVWTGVLPHDRKEAFAFEAAVSADLKAGTSLYVPVVQECEKAAMRWVEIPAAGQSHKDLKEPAPTLKLLPAGAPAAVAAAPAPLHVHLHGAKAMADVMLAPGRTGTGNTLTVVPMTMDFAALPAKAIRVALTQPAQPAIRSEVKPGPEGPRVAAGVSLPRGGAWSVRLEIDMPDGATVVLDGEIAVPSPAS
ncbi:YcnI family copper-binding membrane protein [Alsobacter sp. R-9]